MDYDEGITMTGFYVALNEDNGAGMAGFSPEAVLRTLSGLQVVQGGCESVAPVSAAPPGRYTPHSKKPRTFRDGVLVKTQKQKAQSFD
ncbi:TPA: hypothetical protein PIN48_003043 [Klebsiella variicola subsp. variicola]|nr:hypothetical protein [Klebsiella variicola subsp. variicola]